MPMVHASTACPMSGCGSRRIAFPHWPTFYDKVQCLDDFLFDVMTVRLALGMATGNTVAVGGLWNLVGSKQ